eukprot:Phypoly_transcript_12836.p1 GENE.Phypoly_transcript_12836~~Phypoly_transcript_12836.p1  ORF type:complete len:367 (+),score=39.71 Phypoly_transcript_12836:49-1101(+)
MDFLRVFPQSAAFPYRLAFTGDFVWVYRLGILASFDLLKSKWDVVHNMPPKLVKFVEMGQNKKEVIMTNDCYMGSVGRWIHLLNEFGHHVYDSETKHWSQLPKCDVKDFCIELHSTQSGFFWIHAREYVYLFVKFPTPVFPRYNLLKKVWDACPNPLPEPIVNCAWDHNNKIYVWTTQKSYVYVLDKGTWVEDDSLYLKNVGVAFCTDEFNPGWSEDVELRNSIINNGHGDNETWSDMHKHNKISKEEQEFMEQVESLPLSEKAQFFRRDKELSMKVFKSPVISNTSRALNIALQIAQEDQILGTELSKVFKFYETTEDGQVKYFPASAEAAHKTMVSGNRSHLYTSYKG